VADAMREALEKIAAFDCDSWMIGAKCSGCRTCIAAEALAQHPAMSAADEAEQFIQDAIDRAPEPLRRLGEYLTQILDEDEWRTAERMLIGAAQQPAQGEAAALLAAYNAGHQRGHESTVEGCWSDDSAGLAVDWLSDHPEYTAPPAPSVVVPDALRESYGCNPSYIADVTGLAPAKEVNHE